MELWGPVERDSEKLENLFLTAQAQHNGSVATAKCKLPHIQRTQDAVCAACRGTTSKFLEQVARFDVVLLQVFG